MLCNNKTKQRCDEEESSHIINAWWCWKRWRNFSQLPHCPASRYVLILDFDTCSACRTQDAKLRFTRVEMGVLEI